MTSNNIPYKRQYTIGTCFLCQQCLYCDTKLSFIRCKCDLNIKPTLKNTKKEKSNLYFRVYNPQTKNTVYNKLQLEKLEEANTLYSYNTNFLSKFNFSLCILCHNMMARLKRKLLKNTKTASLKTSKPLLTKRKDKSSSLDQFNSIITTKKLITKEIYKISSDDNKEKESLIYDDKDEKQILEGLDKEDNITTDEEIGAEVDDDLEAEESEEFEEEILPEISFKLIIKQKRESSVAKWGVISQVTFINFQKQLKLLIQTQLDKWVGYDDYIVSYKVLNYQMKMIGKDF